MVYILKILFLMITISVIFAGDEEALREDVLNDPAFQKVWSQLENKGCLLYTSDAADEGLGVDLGGRRIIK